MFTIKNVSSYEATSYQGMLSFRHISFWVGNNPRQATEVTWNSPEFNVSLFLLNTLCVTGIAHSDSFLEESGSYYMSLNEYRAPPRFHTAVWAGFLGLESFHGNRLDSSGLIT